MVARKAKLSLARIMTVAAAAMLAAGSPSAGNAEDRALLIGVGDYRDERVSDLPGIDLDVGIAAEIADLMGFSESQIKVVRDGDATAANVERQFQDWLGKGVGADDRVLVYFSGHGTQIPDRDGDEPDGADEVLVLHDATPADGTLRNVLVDDRFAQLLDNLPSRRVTVLVDACQSGTSTKSLGTRSLGVSEGVDKFLFYPGMPSVSRVKGGFVERSMKGGDNFVAIAAARDDEYAIATSQGSVFTLGVRDSVRKAAQAETDVTPRQVKDAATAFIRREIEDRSRIFHPQIAGSRKLAKEGLGLGGLSDGHGPVWRRLEEVWRRRHGDVGLTLNARAFPLGDNLEISVEVPRSGYLNVVNVGPDDEPVVLYPNAYHKNNKVDRGTVHIPTRQMAFDLVARKPAGPTLVVAILTTKPVNLYESGHGEKGAVFKTLSPKGARAFEPEARENHGDDDATVFAGKQVAKICNSSQRCE